MAKKTKWAHLPNAIHIDWVIKSLITDTRMWANVFEVTKNDRWEEARQIAWDTMTDNTEYPVNISSATKYVAYDDAWHRVTSTGDTSALVSACNAILALIAWDDCAYMIGSDVGELKLLASLGDPRAKLLLLACIVFNETKESI